MIFWQYKITKYFAADYPPWVLFWLIILSIIIIRNYFQLNNDFYTKEFSCLVNSALDNAIYWLFLHQNKQIENGIWKFSTKFLHLLSNTDYMIYKSQTRHWWSQSSFVAIGRPPRTVICFFLFRWIYIIIFKSIDGTIYLAKILLWTKC